MIITDRVIGYGIGLIIVLLFCVINYLINKKQEAEE